MTAPIGVVRQKRRTDRVLEAIEAELNTRRAAINADGTIRSITLVVKMKQGTDEPRAILTTVETERTLLAENGG